MSITLQFAVEFQGEPAAGLTPYSNDVACTVAHDPGGEPGEFADYMRKCLADWFDGARVQPIEPEPPTL